MEKHFLIGHWLRSISASVLFSLSVLFLSPTAADAVDKSGWMTMASAIVGDDVSCGADKVKHELIIRNLETGGLATPPSASFQVYDASDNLVDQANGSGVSTIGPVCFDPDTDAMEISIPNSGAYYSFNGGYVWNAVDAPTVPRGKLIQTTVWLRPKSEPGFDYRHTDPSGVYLNASPTYEIVLNDFPSTYGATGVQRALLFVLDWFTGEVVVKKPITGAPVSGGTGTKTLPAQTLPDGVYTWMYYLNLNGNNNLGGGFSTPNVLMGQRSGYNFPFLLDTAEPAFTAATTHSPPTPSVSDQVTITGAATDALAGITQIRIYLDGVLVKTCPYFYTNSALCNVVTGPFPAGSTHEYYVVATDGAGNVATSPTQSFTVGVVAVCGPANGVSAVNAPSGAADLCSVGTPSSDPAIYNVGAAAFQWACGGPDGLPDTPDDANCSAPKAESFKLCLNSCDSGSVNFSGGTITLGPNETRDLRLCRNVSAICDQAVGDVTDDEDTTFSDTNGPDDAVGLTAVKGQVQAHTAASGDSEVVNVSYSAVTDLSVTFSVPNVCIKDCANAPNVCQGETFNDANGCGTNNCAGSRSCDFNWKEVAPGN